MLYTNYDNIRKKGAKSFSKKVREPLNFVKNRSKKIIVDFFGVIYVIQN
jgi:hypothetical protein